MKPYAIGIDIGGTAIKLGLFQMDGTLLEKWQLPTRTEERGAHVLPDALDSIRAVMARRSILWDDVEGAGMGVPGPVNDEGTVFRCVNLGWDVFSVPEKMRELEPCLGRVKVSNDVNAATLGELWKGGARGYHSAFLVTLGTGIGGGLVLNGRIVNGANGGAGEIGHFRAVRTEPIKHQTAPFIGAVPINIEIKSCAMRTYFRSLAEVLESPLASVAKAFSRTAGQNRVLKSTKLEDMIYQDLRRGDTGLDTLESSCGEKLSTPLVKDGSSPLMRPPANLSPR